MAGYRSGQRFYSKIRIAPGKEGRRTYQLAAGLDQAGADLRDALLDDLARAMAKAGLDAKRVIDPSLAGLAAAEGAEVERRVTYIRTRLLAGKRRAIEEAPTLRQFGAWWTSGELARRYPEQVEVRKRARMDAQDLELHVYPVIGDVQISAVRLPHLEQVLRALPAEMAKITKVKILGKLRRLLEIARYPGGYLEFNPMPKGFAPRPGRVAFPFIYPAEEARLLGCREVPLRRRLAYGLSARTGLRLSEVYGLRWRDLDLEHGSLRLSDHKTIAKTGARLVPLDPATVRVLTWWRAQEGAEGEGSGERSVLSQGPHLSEFVLPDLRAAGVLRAELHEASDGARTFSFHGWRRTFVTLSLGAGRSEDWVMRRTGHTTSAQLHRYRIAAATAAEFGLGWLRDFDQALAEVADNPGGANGPRSSKNADGSAGSMRFRGTPEDSHDAAQGQKPAAKTGVTPDVLPLSDHRGQGADRLARLIEAAIAEARALGLPQVEIRLRNALSASSKRRAS